MHDDGIELRCATDVVLDVLLDERRVWSFWSLRDTEPGKADTRSVRWPRQLAEFLEGRARVTLRSHVDGQVLHEAERTFGTATGRVAVVDSRGRAMSIDKSGRIQVTFDTRSADQVAPLLDSVEEVLAALGHAGVEAFPAYGTLLGAVRDGALIGHDSDADLGYVSRHHHPVDVIRESFALQRELTGMGYRVTRYSGAGFQVLVEESDGGRRGLDVFGGYFDDGMLVLLGEVRVPFEREWVFPLGTTTLEGRELPAPAQPDRLLEAMYGPGWRTPDPAFKFQTPASTTKRLNDWFRGTTVRRPAWDRRYQAVRARHPYRKPTPLPKFLLRQETQGQGPPDLVVDVGCGRGGDARWLARRGLRTLGLDYSARAWEFHAERTALTEPELPLEFGALNLLELRSTLAYGARIGAAGGRRALMARHLVDTLPPAGRHNLWRFLQLACHGGGRAYLEFLVSPVAEDHWAERNLLAPLDVGQVTTELAERGGTVVRAREIGSAGMGVRGNPDTFRAHRRSCRMVVEWTSR